MSNKQNIWTSVEYRIWLLFKRLYAAGLAWLSQGLGTKVLAWSKENRNGVRRLYAKDERIMVTWGQISMKQGYRNEGWNKGNKDEQRGVGDVTEIEWTWGQRRYCRKGAAWDGFCQRSISDPISNRFFLSNTLKTHIYAGPDPFSNHTTYLHKALGFMLYAITHKESILTHLLRDLPYGIMPRTFIFLKTCVWILIILRVYSLHSGSLTLVKARISP